MLRTTVFLGVSMVEQKHRRWLVAIMYLVLLVAVMAVVLARSHVPGRYVSLIAQLFLLSLIFEWRILRHLVGELVLEGRPAKPTSLGLSATRRDPDEPDERDVTVRNVAYFKAYRVLAWYSILASFVAAVWSAGHAGVLFILLGVLLVIATTLPQAILLWTEPDVPLEAI